ncbi:hypothetical protein ACGFWI_37650 [Streptomyces sp. NPDC048434]|uniref:hypothetical protein n=1 Tax=Streptomyces sp. NPDC048434 TaxID=3365549 RepID=UPI003718B0BC
MHRNGRRRIAAGACALAVSVSLVALNAGSAAAADPPAKPFAKGAGDNGDCKGQVGPTNYFVNKTGENVHIMVSKDPG